MQEPDSTNSVDSPTARHRQSHPIRITFKLPSISGMNLRRSTRRPSSAASGSEYHASEKSVDMDQDVEETVEHQEPLVEYGRTRSGRRVKKNTYIESSEGEIDSAANLFSPANDRRVNRAPSKRPRQDSVEDEDEVQPRRLTRRATANHLGGFISPDDEEDGEQPYGLRPRKKFIKSNGSSTYISNKKQSKPQPPRHSRTTRRSVLAAQNAEDDFRPPTSSAASVDAEGSIDEAPGTSDLEVQHEPEQQPEPDEEEPDDGKPYSLRQRQPVNYAIPPPLEDLPAPPRKNAGKNTRNGYGGSKKRSIGWSASGAELGRWMGMPADDSVSNHVLIYIALFLNFL